MNAAPALSGIGPTGCDSRRYLEARSMLAALRPYRASRALEAFIVAAAPKHYATPAAPSTMRALRKAAANADTRGLPVFDGGCDRTIYSSARVNHAFRAWHDSLHLATGAGFTPAGEARVNRAGIDAARDAGLPAADLEALHCDVFGQVRYAQLHDGGFPANQALFVAACLAYGIECAAGMPAELFQ